MIKWIKTYFEKRAKAQEERETKTLIRKSNAIKKVIAEVRELRKIAIDNTMYIRASINVINGTINSAKGNSAAETKRKRIYLRRHIAWLESKLPEEEGMVEYYTSLLPN